VLAPRISGHAVGLHPLDAMFALLAGFQLAGLLGGLFAVTLPGVLWVLLGATYRNVVVERLPHANSPLSRAFADRRAGLCLTVSGDALGLTDGAKSLRL